MAIEYEDALREIHPEPNSERNEIIQDVVGNKADIPSDVIPDERSSLISIVKGVWDWAYQGMLNTIELLDNTGTREDVSFSDFNHHPTIFGHLKAMYFHAHGRSFCIPDNDPVEITPSAVAWDYGQPVLIGTNDTFAFDVHWVAVTDINNNGYYNVELCNEEATVIYGKTFVSRTANFTQEGNVPIQISPLEPNTPVYARLAVSTGNATHTVKVKLFAHPYADLTV